MPGVRARISQLWVLTHGLIKVRDGVLTQRDVKNEGTSGDMYENKGEHDKTSGEKHGFLHLNAANEPKLTGIGADLQPRITDSQDHPDESWLRISGVSPGRIGTEKRGNGGSSGDVDENKGGQVSGVRCQGGTGDGLQSPLDPHAGKSAKMEVHPGMLMKTKEGRFQVPGVRAGPGMGCRARWIRTPGKVRKWRFIRGC